MIGWALLGSLCLVGGFGLSAEAAIVVSVVVTFLSMFQHANIKTPHWLGYLIIRPESHTLHHQRGVHRHNYCDLPLCDMNFGTFRNRRQWEGEAGFYDGASRRLGALPLGKETPRPVFPGRSPSGGSSLSRQPGQRAQRRISGMNVAPGEKK